MPNEENVNQNMSPELEPIEGKPGWYYNPITGQKVHESELGGLLDGPEDDWDEDEEWDDEDDMEDDQDDNNRLEKENKQKEEDRKENNENPDNQKEDPKDPDTPEGEANPEPNAEGMPEGGEGLAEGGAEAAGEAAAEAGEVAAETAATAAAESAVAGAAATEAAVAVESTPVGWIATAIAAIAIIVVIVVIIFMAFMGYSEDAAGDTSGTCLVDLSLGSPNIEGYYQLPASTDYDMNGGSPPAQQWGSEDEIQIIADVARKWVQAHPATKFAAGDLNSPGHHDGGDEFDIYSLPGSPIFEKAPGHVDKPSGLYDQALTIELGKLFLDTGALNRLVHSNDDVNQVLSDYATANGINTPIYDVDGHDDHFHIQVNLGVYSCEGSAGTRSGDWFLPVDAGAGFIITSHFGARNTGIPGASTDHKGVDLSIPGSADLGKPVYAIQNGKVTGAGAMGGCGNGITIEHDTTYSSTYCHLQDGGVLVSVGDNVSGGVQIGKLGSTGVSSGPHLHFGIKKNGTYVDPEDIIDFSDL